MRLLSFTFLAIIAFNGVYGASDYCKLNTESCECVSDSGWGVDLRNISGKYLDSLGPNDSTGYLVSLCRDSRDTPPLNFTTNDCHDKGYTVCEITPGANQTFSGNVLIQGQHWTTVTKEAGDGSLTFGVTQDISVRLVCVQDTVEPSLVLHEKKLFVYSSASCLSLLHPPPPPPVVEGLGTGAVITIIILVTLFSYCTLGIVYNHFIRGTRGAELIPNVDFWRGLPGLCMDGVRFLQNGCRPPNADIGGGGRDTYDSI